MSSKMVFIILAVFLITTGYSEVQYDYHNVDKFSGKTVFKTTPIIILKKLKFVENQYFKNLSFNVEVKDNKNALHLNYMYKYGGIPSLGITPSNHLLILLESGEKLKLPLTQPITKVIRRETSSWPITHYFLIPDEQLLQLKKSKISDIRLVTNKDGFEFTIPEEKRALILEMFTVLPYNKDVHKEEVTNSEGI